MPIPPETPAARFRWRVPLLWGLFFAALLAGLLFAARRGGDVPVLLDVLR